jgi:hypothetical protein
MRIWPQHSTNENYFSPAIRPFIYFLLISFSSFTFLACSTSRQSIVNKKYSPEKLRSDFKIFRAALEESHPSLYWFTPKSEIDKAFDDGYARLSDSMTERQFRTLLVKTITPIRCGHTSVNYSRKYSHYLDTAEIKLFPLAFKVWADSLAVTGNLNKADSTLKRGTIVTAINNKPAKTLIDTFFNYITGDGYSITGRYQTLSSYGTFGVLYKNVFGLTDSFHIRYIKNNGGEAKITIPVFTPTEDTSGKKDTLSPERYTPKERRTLTTFATRHVQVDTTLKSAYMLLNTFANGNRLRRFFISSFKNIKKYGIQHLVIDVRSNGGGEAGNSTLLTQYLADHKFRIADSLYAVKRSSKYRDYIRFQPIYWLITTVITRKREDGKFHFGYYERHVFKPFKKNHFDGNIYILTGGNSFSATTLFVQELKGQKNVKIIGEETGGGAYGNTAWIIPQLTLPNTKVRVGIPKFRFVMRKEMVKEGRGVMPDIHVAPTARDIQNGIDVKMETVKRMIMRAQAHQ